MISRSFLIFTLAVCLSSAALARRANEVITVYYSNEAKTKEVGRKTIDCEGRVELSPVVTKFTNVLKGAKCPNNGETVK